MSLKWKETRKNKDGSKTERVRYSDGSGHDTKYRDGLIGRKEESVRRYPKSK